MGAVEKLLKGDRPRAKGAPFRSQGHVPAGPVSDAHDSFPMVVPRGANAANPGERSIVHVATPAGPDVGPNGRTMIEQVVHVPAPTEPNVGPNGRTMINTSGK